MEPKTTKKRFHEYGFRVGLLQAGPKHSITDVPGVRVGHYSKIEGDDIRTGITIIDPGVGIESLFRKKLPAAFEVGNGTGKVAGLSQVQELGTLEAPIALTNTLAVGPVTLGMLDCVRSELQEVDWVDTINVVVGEINDGRLNRIHKNTLGSAEVRAAFDALTADPSVGNVGGGTGARAFSWKGGIGMSSRKVAVDDKTYTVGVLTQTNFGGALTILGVPVWKHLGITDFDGPTQPTGDGSNMVVLATDAPLTARQLKRMARRTFLAMSRVGAVLHHPSGDYAAAFTTSRQGLEGSGEVGQCLPDTALTPFFLATVEAVEESIYDTMFTAETMRGRDGRVLEALPLEKVLPLLEPLRTK